MKQKTNQNNKIHDTQAALRFFINFKTEINEAKDILELREPSVLNKYEECLNVLKDFCRSQTAKEKK